jgi:Ca-activated chloride channel family protein
MSFHDINGAFASLASLHWLRPQWLWLLLALPLLGWWWRARDRQRSVWRDVVDPHLLPHLLEGHPGGRARGGLWLGLLGLALAICALAGPSWQRVEQPLWQNRAPLVIALDLSSATLANDLPPSRLLQARAKIATLLRTRAGGQVGLVAFADDAYTVAPLTEDAGNVAVFLDALGPDVMPVDGSRAGRAIAWSAKLLQQAGFDHGDILLLTDHADGSARSAATAAAGNGYRVSALGLGTASGAAYRDADGGIEHAQLDAASLRDLTSAGDGAYAALGAGNGDLATLGVLDPSHAGAMATRGEKTSIWRDQGYWLLLPLLLLALLAFRRGGALSMLLLAAWLPMQPAQAATSDWWRRPDQQMHAHLDQGAEAYRKNDFATAQKQWSNLPGADAAYNRGNALAKQGNYDAAIAAYDQALHLQPGMADAMANKRAVEAAKQRKPPSGKQPGNQNNQNSQQQQSGQQSGHQSGQQSGQQNQPGQLQSGQPPQGQGASPQQNAKEQGEQNRPPPSPTQPSDLQQGQPPPDKLADSKAQRAADAAQRQRMQQALQQAALQQTQARSGNDKLVPKQRVETAGARERRLANEAWLSRVPDEPGGLLRAKFRLEYERRQQGGN